jgi:hypothetical protein
MLCDEAQCGRLGTEYSTFLGGSYSTRLELRWIPPVMPT